MSDAPPITPADVEASEAKVAELEAKIAGLKATPASTPAARPSVRQLLDLHYAEQDLLVAQNAAQRAEQAATDAQAAGPLPAGRQWRLSDNGLFSPPVLPKPIE